MLEEAGAPGSGIWPLTLCPGGAAARRRWCSSTSPLAIPSPTAGCAELLRRLNELKGVDITEGKLKLRPNFRLALLEGDANRELLAETLAWFRHRWDTRDTA
ncbi:hypothetical protein [Streptomyces sp. NPDC093149]|uniref:hypothetical protein n=1 Tax=Streptomyces sp. NPDC093149 TaxID=3366031 RepID=UPI00382E8DEE